MMILMPRGGPTCIIRGVCAEQGKRANRTNGSRGGEWQCAREIRVRSRRCVRKGCCASCRALVCAERRGPFGREPSSVWTRAESSKWTMHRPGRFATFGKRHPKEPTFVRTYAVEHTTTSVNAASIILHKPESFISQTACDKFLDSIRPIHLSTNQAETMTEARRARGCSFLDPAKYEHQRVATGVPLITK